MTSERERGREELREHGRNFRAWLRTLSTDELIAVARSRGILVPGEHDQARAKSSPPRQPPRAPRNGASERWPRTFTIAFPRPANRFGGSRLESGKGLQVSYLESPPPPHDRDAGEARPRPPSNRAGAEEGQRPPPGPAGPPSGEGTG